MKPRVIIKDLEREITTSRIVLHSIFVRGISPYQLCVFCGTFIEENTKTELLEVSLIVSKITDSEIKLKMIFSPKSYHFGAVIFLIKLLLGIDSLSYCLDKLVYSSGFSFYKWNFLKFADEHNTLELPYKIENGKIARKFGDDWIDYIVIGLSPDFAGQIELINKKLDECPETKNRYISASKLWAIIKQLDFQIKRELFRVYKDIENYLIKVVNEALAGKQY